MRAATAGLTVFLAACEPPPVVAGSGEPAITIAYPPRDVGTIATNCDGALDLLVVVDIDNLQLQSPYVPDVELVDGQGHWHAVLGGLEGYTPSFTHSSRVLAENVTSGAFTVISVHLQDNLHDDLVGDGVEDSIEFQIVDPLPEECP